MSEQTEHVNTTQPDANAEGNQSLAEAVEAGKTEGFSADLLNKRLLEESKLHKQKFLETRRELTELRKAKESADLAKLEEDKKYKEAYESTRQELDTLRRERLSNSLERAVLTEAQKLGCHSVQDLMRVGDSSLLHLDETNGEVQGVELFVEKAKREKPWLFGSTKPTSVNPSLPPMAHTDLRPGKEDLSKLSDKEIELRLKSLG